MSLMNVNLLTSTSASCDQNENNEVEKSKATKETSDNNLISLSHAQKSDSSTDRPQPLLKIIFRDQQTMRKYRKKMEQIINYVLATQIDEENDDDLSTVSDLNLVLEINNPNPSSDSMVTNKRKPIDKVNFSTIENKKLKHINDNNTPKHIKMPESNVRESSEHKITYAEQKKQDDCSIPEYLRHENSHNKEKQRVEIQPIDSLVSEPIKVTNDGNTSLHDISTSGLSELCHLEICFEKNSVKIGSYRYYQYKIFLSKNGLTLTVPSFKGDEQLKNLNIRLQEIVQVLINFSMTSSVFFFLVSPETGKRIRHLLSMDDPTGLYFDPDSEDLLLRFIAIMPTKIADESQAIIMELFKNKEVILIDEIYAKDLINRETTRKKSSQNEDEEITTHENLKKCGILSINNKKIQDELEDENKIGCSDSLETTLLFRTVRIGSYKYSKEGYFSISKNGLTFCVPALTSAALVTITIGLEEINKIAMSFSNVLPVSFFYISEKAARMIRKMLDMKDPDGAYIHNSEDDTCNKIIIISQQIPKESEIIKILFDLKKLEELNNLTAYTLLEKSMPKSALDEIKKLDQRTAINTLMKSSQDNRKSFKIPILDKKYIHTPTSVVSPYVPPKYNNKSTRPIVLDSTNVALKAIYVKIGTYKCKTKSPVIISKKSLNLNIPLARSNTCYKNIIIEFKEISEFAYHFSTFPNTFFIRTSKFCADEIKKLLNFKIGQERFDPGSFSLDDKWIIICFYPIVEKNNQIMLKKLIGVLQARQITEKDAMILNNNEPVDCFL